MPQDFSGTALWHALITGPDNDDGATGDSVSDMGVLLADRTMFLASAFDTAFKVKALGTVVVLDAASAYADTETIASGTSWAGSVAYALASIDFSTFDYDRLRVTWHGRVRNDAAAWAELRLEAGLLVSPHVRVEPSEVINVSIELQTAAVPPGAAVVSLAGRLSAIGGGNLVLVGSGALHAWSLTEVVIP